MKLLATNPFRIDRSANPRQHVADLTGLAMLIEGNMGLAPKVAAEELAHEVAACIADMAARYPGYEECLRFRSGQTFDEIVAATVTRDAEDCLISRRMWADDGHQEHWASYLEQDDGHRVLGKRDLRAGRAPLSDPVSPVRSAWLRQRPVRKARPKLRQRRPVFVLKQMYQALTGAVRADMQAAAHLAMLQFLSLRQVCPDWYAPYLGRMPLFEHPQSTEA